MNRRISKIYMVRLGTRLEYFGDGITKLKLKLTIQVMRRKIHFTYSP
jgi:hypothetical protein